jgi:type VI secretion system secreted protein VgrG
MPEHYTQANRLARIDTPLGADKLLFKSLAGVERLGRPFEFELVLLSTDPDIDPLALLGQEVTVTMHSPYAEDVTRHFSGVVRTFAQTNWSRELSQYVATIVPQLAFSAFTTDLRIFQEKTAPEIIEQVVKTEGVVELQNRLSETYPTREYCVQYRETNLDFVHRLMEEEGIYYYFKHSDGKHELVLSDSPGSHDAAPSSDTVPFITAQTASSEPEGLVSWAASYEVRSGGFVHSDYDFTKATTALRSNDLVDRSHAQSAREVYDYPGLFTESREGDRLAKVHMTEIAARHVVFRGVTTAAGLAVGTKFTLQDHPKGDYNREYLVIENEVRLDNAPYRTGSSQGERELKFTSRIAAIPANQVYRPPRVTPRPNLRGPHTAVVVGPSGDEIHTDEYGRIKVQFHWDREGQRDENSSCFIRVAQTWAHARWGMIFLPRIGQEVVVEFLEGEPDRPLVTGAVYNSANMPPYALPENKTISAIRTQSTPDGGAGYNELRFEDKKDEEQIFVHAQKDFDLRVLNDRKEWIGQDSHLWIVRDQIEHVERDRHELVEGKHVEQVDGDFSRKIGGKQALHVVGKRSLKVSGDVGEKFEANASREIQGDYYVSASNIVLEATDNITLKVGSVAVSLTANDGIKIDGAAGDVKVEANNIEEKATANWKAEATGNATVKSTSNLSLEGTAGAELKSTANVDVKATAQLNLEGTAMAALKGTGMAKVESSGILIVQGSLVKIN